MGVPYVLPAGCAISAGDEEYCFCSHPSAKERKRRRERRASQQIETREREREG
jgi:hypothetical protein